MGKVENPKSASVSRRSFLQASAALAAAVGVAGCAPTSEDAGQENGPHHIDDAELVDNDPGTWVLATCWANCGGSCCNKALVKDGVIVRQKTDDTVEDTWEKPQQRGCVRGRSMRRYIYGTERLKYPMKRKSWSPENPNGHLRGKDEWERITWDEAFTYVADQVNKVLAEVGPSGIYCPGYVSYGALNAWKVILGSTGSMPTTAWDTGSAGTYNMNTPALGLPEFDMGPFMLSVMSSNDRFDNLNADTIILQGCNPAWASGGNRMMNLLEPMKRGVEFIYVGPSYNISASTLGARWIPVLPGTDIPFMLAAAYVMLTEDDPQSNPLIDWDFLEKYTVGFTMDTLPDYAQPKECFMDYVLGKYDDLPKTPEWASAICGAPVEDIQYYARSLTKQKNVMLLHSYAPARCMGAEDFPQLFLTLGCMGGHIGKEGNATGAVYHHYAGDAGPKISQMNLNAAGFGQVGDYFNGEILNVTQVYDAILTGKYDYVGNPTPTNDWREPEKREIDIRMIWSEGHIGLQTVVGAKKGIEAYRALDFIVTQEFVMNTDARYSDIVLPVSMPWERWGTGFGGPKQTAYIPQKVIDPLYDSKSDAEICKGVMDAMGFDSSATFAETPQEMAWLGAMMLMETRLPDGTVKPLVNIPQEVMDAYHMPLPPVEGVMSWEDAINVGVYHADPDEATYRYIAYEDFIKDPEANPLPSQSGKFEIACQWKADYLNKMPFNADQTFKPYPTYTSKGYAWEATSSEYPYVMYQPHYLRRSHTEFDAVNQLREAFTNPVFLNASDAKAKGIQDGDVVRVWTEFGSCIRHATLLESVMPGAVGLPHGAWMEYDEEEDIERAGADNFLCGEITSASAVSGYNSYPVNFEKYDGELEADCMWPSRGVDLD